MQRKSHNRHRYREAPRLVLLVAGGLLQIPMARAIKRRGYLLAVADNDERCIARELADVFCACDIRSATTLVAIARAIGNHHPVAFAITAATDFSRQVAIINRALSLPTITSVSTATLTTDKSKMRSTLQRHRIAVPRFVVLKNADDFSITDMPLPAVVKPVDSMGGRGVKLISTVDQLPTALIEAQSHSQKNIVLCEQYITDHEYSVEMLVRNYRLFAFVIADRYIYCRPFFVEMGHLLPAVLSRRTYRTIRATCRRVIRAIGIRHGVAKFDLFYRNRRTIIGEVACRLSGGYMSGWTFPQARGRNINEGCLAITERRLHYRRRPRIHSCSQTGTGNHAPHRSAYSGECAMLSLPGRVAAINGIHAARQLSGVTHVFMRCRPNDSVDFPTNNVQKCLNIIIAAKSVAVFWDIARAARRNIDIRLVAGDERTLAFLFADYGRQFPMAYAPPPAFIAWLKTQRNDRQLSVVDTPNLTIALPPTFPPLTDWHVFSLHKTVEQLCVEYQLTTSTDQIGTLGQSFWRAILKGGLQGGRFFLDTLRGQSDLLNRWITQWNGSISDV